MTSRSSLYKWFEQVCIEQFSFLEKRFGFRREKIETDETEASILYAHKDIAVSVRYEPLDNIVIAFIVRTEDGHPPDYNAADWLNVDNVMRERGLPEVRQEKYGEPFSNRLQDFRHILSGYSTAIEEDIEKLLQKSPN